MGDWGGFPRYQAARPLATEGGIAARSRRGPIGETWWSRRFIELLESFGVGSRLKRGRSYARSGQVTGLEVEPGLVLATVQGTRHTPYRVRIQANALSEGQWHRAERAITAEALPLAQLLAGEMPREIEAILADARLSLFPRRASDLRSFCDCPDWENPCKHVAAAFYILAERFDEDPFLIFAWRGRTREELLAQLRARRAKAARESGGEGATAGGRRRRAESLADRRDSFWHSGPKLAELRVRPLAAEAPDGLLRQLGPCPAKLGERDVAELLEPTYEAIAEAAERKALGS